MKASLNWVKWINEKYGSAANPAPKGVEPLVEKIGAQLGAVEEVVDLGKKYEGIVVAKVVKCDKHPNADKLSVCLVDDGGAAKKVKRDKNGLVQVVCGAPNVKAGQLVAWIPPGVVVPSTHDKDPFVLKAIKLRGVVSNGMIASAKELALGDDHQGILVIDQPAKPGQAFAAVYHLDDYIIDIENKMFTHRPDLFGMLGIAREIAGIQQQVFRSPSWYKEHVTLPKPRGDGLKLTVKNQLPKVVPRFTAIVIRDIAVKPSPLWLQTKLSRVGIRPVNNIVDLTNLYMYETAQPLHAYDYDKVGNQLQIRPPKKGEKLKLLGGKVINLQPQDIVIAAADRAIGLGGVMGGADSEVDAGTRNIIIECANFSMTAVRKTAMTHGLFTDAATRFTKDQSPRQNLTVLAKLVEDVLKPQLSGGRIASPVFDLKHFKANPAAVNLSLSFINQRLGLNLGVSEVKKLLENVEFKVGISGDKLKVEAPFWRTDIEIPEDIIEEVGRLYGYDNLNLELPIKDLTPAKRGDKLDLKQNLRDILSSAGANEVQTYSFVPASLLEKAGQDPKNSYHIRNALSPELQYYRQSLTPGLLEKIHPNIKAGYDEFALFEMGKAYFRGILDEEKLPQELERLSVVFARKKLDAFAPYFMAKKICDYLLRELGILGVHYEPISPDYQARNVTYYQSDKAADIKIDGRIIGRIGEFRPDVAAAFKLPPFSAGFDLHTDELLNSAYQNFYQPLNRFPSLSQDLTLKAPASLHYEQLTKFIGDYLSTVGGKHGHNYQLEPLDIFQKDSAHKQTTWRITLEHPERTLTNEEVNALLEGLAAAAKKTLKAERV